MERGYDTFGDTLRGSLRYSGVDQCSGAAFSAQAPTSGLCKIIERYRQNAESYGEATYKKTVGDMISERIITQARHELYLSDKPIKQIALELGFHDVAYFSRFFKVRTTISPEVYRKSFREDTD